MIYATWRDRRWPAAGTAQKLTISSQSGCKGGINATTTRVVTGKAAARAALGR